MQRLSLFLLLLIVCFCPSVSGAHGGIEHSTESSIVTLNQSPLSPLVGEKVTMAFILTDKEKVQRLTNTLVSLSIKRQSNDPKKDVTVYTTSQKADDNGTAVLEYTFSQPGYYDTELQFIDQTGQEQTVGFLTQVRDTKLSTRLNLMTQIITLVVGMGLGIIGSSFFGAKSLRER